jgi:nicotinamide-nucleotide amidase
MRAYIISIGSELIQGALTDTNATWLAREFISQGIELLHVVQVSDDLDRLTRTLRQAASEADLVVCTGGVGPTDDDLTREAIAALAGETPEVDSRLLETIRAYFTQRGLEMAERNAKQAWLIPSAEALPNPVGTAPGWFVRSGDAVIVAMPGVPREMFRMWKEQALPRIAPLLPNRVFRSTNLRTLGIGESAVAQVLGDLTKQTNPYVGTYAKDDGVHVVVTAASGNEDDAVALLSESLTGIRELLGQAIYTEDTRSLPAVLLDHLRVIGTSLAVAESGSGGRFASLLLGEPDAGDVLLGSLAFAPGSGTAAELAALAMERIGAGCGMGLTAEVTPVGNGLHEGVVTVALSGSLAGEESFPIKAAYLEVQRRAAMHAADMLRRTILASDDGQSHGINH